MKITYNWLREYVDFPWDWNELVERLTMAGLEREGVVDLGQRYEGIVVGRVLERREHPNADRLSVCQVDVGTAVNTIVCGAPNVAAEQKVAVILPGFSLPDGSQIKKTKIRGVESSGMICSEIELALGEDAAGILVLPDEVKVGHPFATQVGLQDVVLDFEVTPNRPDCLSLLGLAREVRALTGTRIKIPPRDTVAKGPATAASIALEIEDRESCPRYVGRIVRGIKVGPSPAWLQQRLQAVGQRPINNIVDATNYVMRKLGQPLHAFDLHKLAENRIVVRRAQAGEKLEILDGTHCELDEEILVIADGQKPVALAGIMGGSNSEVTATTNDILLEGAYFNPVIVRRGCTLTGLHTEASMRFERGADFEMPPLAIDRVAHLVAELAGGQIAPAPLDLYPQPLQQKRISARIPRINQLLATQLDGDTIGGILELLGCEVDRQADILEVIAPSFRPDLQREVDLIEEVGRIHGYDHIEGSQDLKGPLGHLGAKSASMADGLRYRLAGLGLDEVMSNTIVERKWLDLANSDETQTIDLKNPPTEAQGVLRSTLIPSLLDVARRNFNQRAPTVAIFELGKCFSIAPEDQRSQESLHLAGLWSGQRTASTWLSDQQEVGFLDLKGLLETLLENAAPQFVQDECGPYRRGRCARVQINGHKLGFLGEAAPALLSGFDIECSVYIFEVDFQILLEQWHLRPSTFEPLARFPSMDRDLAVVVREDISATEVIEQIRQTAPELIESVGLFDLYQGDQVANGHKSLAFSLRLRSIDKTLQDKQANKIVDQVLASLKKAFDADLRLQ